MDEHAQSKFQSKPDFVVIGAMKCATSTLHDQLAHHDGISMSDPKEPNFFSDEENWAKGLSWYESLFASMGSGDIKGESSTHYTKLPTYQACAERLHTYLPGAKLIYVMRDPIERLVSQYIHEWSMHAIPDGCSIDQAIREYPMLVDYSRYAMQLAPYIELFGRDAILPVFYERATRWHKEELTRIAEHIGYVNGVHWREDDAKNVSSQRQRRSPMLDKVLNLKAVHVARRTLMPESLRAKIRSRWTMDERPKLSNDSIAYLREQLDPEMEILGRFLGIELCCDNFKERVLGESTIGWAGGVGDGHG